MLDAASVVAEVATALTDVVLVLGAASVVDEAASVEVVSGAGHEWV